MAATCWKVRRRLSAEVKDVDGHPWDQPVPEPGIGISGQAAAGNRIHQVEPTRRIGRHVEEEIGADETEEDAARQAPGLPSRCRNDSIELRLGSIRYRIACASQYRVVGQLLLEGGQSWPQPPFLAA